MHTHTRTQKIPLFYLWNSLVVLNIVYYFVVLIQNEFFWYVGFYCYYEYDEVP